MDPAAAPDPGPAPAAGLADVVALLHPCLRVLAPAAAARPVSRAVVHDPTDLASVAAGDVVLAVGLTAGAAARLVADAGAREAAAVVVRVADPPRELVDAAVAADVALLSVEPGLPWGELHRLLTAAVAVADTRAAASDGVGGTTAVDDLFALCDLVASELGGPVIVEDAAFRVLAYSSLAQPDDEPRRRVILGRRVLDDWLAQLTATGLRRRLLTGDEVIALDADFVPGSRARRVAPIRAAGELLGVLWVSEGTAPFAPDVDGAVRRAAGQLAAHLVRVRAGRDHGGARRSAALRGFLDGTATADALAAALAVPVTAPCAVVAFAVAVPDPAGTRLARLRDLLDVQFAALRRTAVGVRGPDAVHCLVVLGRSAPDELPAIVAGAAARLAAALGVPVRAGYGSVVGRLDQARRSAAEADQVLGVLGQRPGAGPVAGIDDVRESVVLAELDRVLRDRPALLRGRVADLVRHDEEHGTRYVETLRAYLDCVGDHARAAARLHLHVNSFRYRIRRLAEIAGLDLDDPEHRLVAQLQLRVLRAPDGT